MRSICTDVEVELSKVHLVLKKSMETIRSASE